MYVDAPEAARLLDFACATYGLLLRCLVQSFGRIGTTAHGEQKVLVSAAIGLMHVLGDASTRLARLPASSSLTDVNAGMSFTMLRGVEPLLPGPVERTLLIERVEALIEADVELGAAAERALKQAAGALTAWTATEGGSS